jgi:hypothetical protein
VQREVTIPVIHLDGEIGAALAQVRGVPGDGPVIAVLPRGDLAAAVDVMRSSPRVAGVLAADAHDAAQLAAMARRIADDDVLGLDKVVAPGTAIHTRVAADHPGKLRCLARLGEFLDQIGAPGRHREAIEQCVDEMVMNALYDAPLGADGKPLFAGVPIRERIALRSAHSVVVQYAHDGRRLAVAVRDAFGALERDTVLAALYKCLHAERAVESRAGGAGLGLYLMLHSSTAVQFCVLPGVATEVICMFDLEAPRLALAELGFLVQRDARGARTTGPSRRRRVWRPARVAAAALAVVAAVLGGAALWRAVASHTATLEIDSQPTGAAIEIDGTPFGAAPLIATSLEPRATVSIVFRRTGYRPVTVVAHVPAAGDSGRVVQRLELSDELVRVRLVSNPPGAEVVRTGQPPTADRTYTPAELFLPAGEVQRFTLIMPGHVPLVIEPFTPRPAPGARVLEKGGDLVAGANLRIEATIAGAVSIAGAPHCQDLALPADCTLAPGGYVLELRAPDGARFAQPVTMTDLGKLEQLELGFVQAAPGKRLVPGDSARQLLEAGTHTVTVSDARGRHAVVVTVQPGATAIAE